MKVVLDKATDKLTSAFMPVRAHEWDAGYDLFSREAWKIFPGEYHEFDTGVHMAIPHGMCGLIVSKSGLNSKENVQSTGLIDSDYIGSIKVKLYNFGKNIVCIEAGQKISQMVILPVYTPDLELVTELETTDRGEGGFGSSGKF